MPVTTVLAFEGAGAQRPWQVGTLRARGTPSIGSADLFISLGAATMPGFLGRGTGLLRAWGPPRARCAVRTLSEKVSADLVRQLRQQTGAPINKCKQALEAEGANLEAAAVWLRKAGAASAQKKAARGTTEGVIVVAQSSPTVAAILELNSETDFVARNEHFLHLAERVSKAALTLHVPDESGVRDLDVPHVSVTRLPDVDGTVEEAVVESVAKLGPGGSTCLVLRSRSLPRTRRGALVAGENLRLRRAALVSTPSGIVSHYVHNTYRACMGRTAAVLAIEPARELSESDRAKVLDMGNRIAMHIVAAAPQYMTSASVPEAVVDEERNVIRHQLSDTKKSPEVIEKIVTGKLKKYFKEVCLLEQTFLLDDTGSVEDVLESCSKDVGVALSLTGFVRYHVSA